MRNRKAVGLIALFLLLAMPMLAQNNTGIISGRVTDPSGAVIPNAQITVTQTETNVEVPSATNSDGLFRMPSLINGPYKVTIIAAGFKKQVRDGITLRIGENLNVEVKLDVGAVTEAVEVTSALPLLDTQTSSTGQVMEGDYFYKLPNYQHWEKGVLYYTPQVQHQQRALARILGQLEHQRRQRLPDRPVRRRHHRHQHGRRHLAEFRLGRR